MLSRRGVLAAGAALGLLAGCGPPTGSQTKTKTKTQSETQTSPGTGTSPDGARRLAYGTDDSQFVELQVPSGVPLGTVVLLHGGYWFPQYGLELMRPLAARLNELGYATWNVEYRRIGDEGGGDGGGGDGGGGGVPATLEDVAAAVDRLAGPGLPAGLTERVVLLGHSAGGHLAGWAASRTADTPGGRPQVALSGSISLSGVLDLTRAASDPRSSGPVTAFLGGTPTEVPERYAEADPALLVPASCRVWAVYAEDDAVVSPEQSSRYVKAATAAGGEAEVVRVPGDHFTLIDPAAESFTTLEELLGTATA